MRFTLIMWCLVALLATGCCGAPTYGDGSKAVIAVNLDGWQRAADYAKASGWPPHKDIAGLPAEDIDPEQPSWWRRYVGWYAVALQLQARANGEVLGIHDAKAMAEEAIKK